MPPLPSTFPTAWPSSWPSIPGVTPPPAST
jgi:hypothetical protein